MNSPFNEHPNHRTTAESAQRMDRSQLLNWLDWNDPNGCYRDEDCLREGLDFLTRETALELVIRSIEDSAPETNS